MYSYDFFGTQVWDALSGDEIHSFQHNHIVKSVDFCESEPNLLATGSNEKLIRIYDLNKPEAGILNGQG
jgi:serine-threonine kinase receptor-associated protein